MCLDQALNGLMGNSQASAAGQAHPVLQLCLAHALQSALQRNPQSSQSLLMNPASGAWTALSYPGA